ncbi:unnamed protein product, partial [marine sediment metagenome]
MAEEEKICFVIGPIGEEGSEIRERSDTFFHEIIAPAAVECGYTPRRADHPSLPG